MHETVIASSLLTIIQETVEKTANGRSNIREGIHSDGKETAAGDEQVCSQPLRVTDVELTVGLLASIEPQTLCGCFEIMAEGTIAESARLHIHTRPMVGECFNCGKTVETKRRVFSCPLCGKNAVNWEEGQGMEITSIRVAEE